MKKKLIMLLAGALTVSMLLTSCGSSSDTESGSSTDTESGSAETDTDTDSSDDTDGSDDADSGEIIEITFGSYGSSSMPPAMGWEDAIAYIEEASGGTIQINFVPDGVLGNESDMMQQVMDGTIEMTECSASSLNLYTSLSEAFQLPFLITDYDTEQAALSSDAAQAIYDQIEEDLGIKIIAFTENGLRHFANNVRPIYDQIEEDLGIKIIAFTENGLRHFANNVRPIYTMDDLSGLKLRIAASNMLTEAMDLMGASAMTVNYNEVYSALQNGVVDGEEINITSVYALNHYEQLEYISEIGMYPYPAFVTFNLDFWNSLTEEQQQIITDGFQLGSDNVFETHLPDYEEEARAAIEEYGVEFNVIEGDEKQEFIDTCTPIWDDYRDMDPLIADFIDYVESLN